MKMTKIENKNNDIIYVQSDKVIINDYKDILDIMMTISHHYSSNKIILDKNVITENFFDLKTKIAGDICQKLIDYKFKMAIVGDYSKYNSKALRDFIYESNLGRDFYFLDSLELAKEKLSDL